LQCFKKLRWRHDQLHGWKSHMRGYSLMVLAIEFPFFKKS